MAQPGLGARASASVVQSWRRGLCGLPGTRIRSAQAESWSTLKISVQEKEAEAAGETAKDQWEAGGSGFQ